jgi:hypothetical protein
MTYSPLPLFVSRFAVKQIPNTTPPSRCPAIAGTLEQRKAFAAAVNAGLYQETPTN